MTSPPAGDPGPGAPAAGSAAIPRGYAERVSEHDHDHDHDLPAVDEDRVASRADGLLPTEVRSGSDRPKEQAEAILEESEQRTADRDDPPQPVEHRNVDDGTA